MAKKKGAISTETGIKPDIITLVLESDGPIEESQIRKQLGKDQGNINRHLHDLKELGCIEINTCKKNFRNCNYWDISSLRNLKIVGKKFYRIPSNVYDKALDLMLKSHGYDSNTLYALKLRIEWIVSYSFFDICLENNDETLNAKGHEMERLDEGFEDYKRLDASIDKVYIEYIKPISINSNIWLNVYDRSINDSLKLQINQGLLKRSFDVEISKDIFRKVLEGMRVFGLMDSREEWSRRIFREPPGKLYTIPAEKLSKILEEAIEKIAEKIKRFDEENFENIGNNRLAEEISAKISYAMFLELLDKIPEEFLDMPEETIEEILEWVFMKIFYEIYKKVMEIPNELFRNMAEIWWHQIESRVKIPDRIFKYCVYRDIDRGVVNPLAKEFLLKLKELEASHKVKDPLCTCDDCNKFYVEFYEKCTEYCKKCREDARGQKKFNIPCKKSVGEVTSQL